MGVPISAVQDEQQPPPTVLLASERTRFKNALVEALESLLVQAGCKVVKIDHSRAAWNQVRAADYDAVFISNSGVNSQVRPWVRAWLDQNKDADAYILLHTTQTRDWSVVVDVDAVTSASAVRDVRQLATDYHGRIAAALKRRASAPQHQ